MSDCDGTWDQQADKENGEADLHINKFPRVAFLRSPKCSHCGPDLDDLELDDRFHTIILAMANVS